MCILTCSKKDIATKFKEVVDIKDLTPEQEDDAIHSFLCLLFSCFLFTNSFFKLLSSLLRYIKELEMLHMID